jgi:predicted permease
MEAFLADLRYALRRLRNAPGFAFAAILTVALGVAGPTYVFSEINAFYLRPLHVAEPDRLVSLAVVDDRGRVSDDVQGTAYAALAAAPGPLSGLGAHAPGSFGLTGEGTSARPVQGRYVSANYFSLLGAAPARGRFFSPAESEGAGEPAAVISYDLWQRAFSGDPGVVGRSVRLSGHPVTVVGVAPEGFNGVTRAVGEDLWLPLGIYERFNPSPVPGVPQLVLVQMFGRLRDGVSPPAAEGELSARARGLADAEPSLRRVRTVEANPLTGMPSVGQAKGLNSKTLHLATALLLLLVASVNVAGMLLARASARRKEIGVRVALGASRSRLVAQLMTESLVIFMAGGAAGVALTALAGRFRSQALSGGPGRSTVDYGLDARVLAFALGSSLLVTLVFGLVPAIQALRVGAVPALRDTPETGGGASRLRGAFIACQVAACVVLLAWAGLFVRALREAWLVNPGFDPENVAVASLDAAYMGRGDAQGAAFFAELAQRLRARPDVSDVALASSVPFGSRVSTREVRAADGAGGDSPIAARASSVTPDFFRTLRIPVLRGRAFNDADREGAPYVVVVSAALARQAWPGEDAVGKRLAQGPRELEVVGVVGDVRAASLAARPGPAMYTPVAQDYSPAMTVLVRSGAGAGAGLAAVRNEVRSLQPDLPLTGAAPFRDLIGGSLAGERTAALRIGSFGLIGLFLSAVGLYAAVAYLVSRRTREIGIRLALGAGASEIVRLFLGRGMRLAGVGLVAGIVGALVSARVAASRLYGLSTVDPVTLTAGALLLLAACALASYLPARRASRLDPLTALRTE